MTPRFKSLLQDYFVDYPREMNLLITGLEEGLPGHLHAKKGIVPYEIISGQMVDRLYNTRGMDRKAAEWVVKTWAEAIKYPFSTPPYHYYEDLKGNSSDETCRDTSKNLQNTTTLKISGSIIWSYKLGGELCSCPVVADRIVYGNVLMIFYMP